MREIWARWIVLFSGLMVLLLAILFAFIQNPTELSDIQQHMHSEQTNPTTLEPERIAKGQQIYRQLTCSQCHSIAGEGNPRNSLDGVGAKLSADELRHWITGADVLQGFLPDAIRNMKHDYRDLADDDLNALVTYLQSLRK